MKWEKIVERGDIFYDYCRECVRVGVCLSEWLPVKVILRLGCVTSLWLFNVDMVIKWCILLSLEEGWNLWVQNCGRFNRN